MASAPSDLMTESRLQLDGIANKNRLQSDGASSSQLQTDGGSSAKLDSEGRCIDNCSCGGDVIKRVGAGISIFPTHSVKV